jgi:hypothetical protein
MLGDARRLSVEIVDALDRLERRISADARQRGLADQAAMQKQVLAARGNGHSPVKAL